MSSSAITPLTITGVSTMSSEWQTVLNRAVSIASLPVQQMQNADADILQKETLLSGLGDAATSLGNAVTALGTLAGGGSLAATSSDPATVSVQNTGATTATNYAISGIQSIASAASATTVGFSSAAGATVSKNGSMRLTFGDSTNTHDFTLTDNSIGGLRDAINGLNAGVTATVLTAGDYNYLSLSANSTGAVTNFSLQDDPNGTPTELLSNPNLGSNAVFQLNGVDINRTTNSVNDVIPGLTFTLLAKPATDETVNLALASDPTQLSSAISDFVTAYNAMATQVQGQVGPNAGMLTGDFVVRDIQNDMRALASYQADGTVKSLWEMGLSFDNTGKLSFDSTKFASLSDSQIQGAMAFFGSTTTGFGALAQKFTSLTDPVSGSIKLEQDGFTRTDKSLQSQMATLTDRINRMQTALASQLQAADALLAGLQSQQSMLTSSLDSLSYVLYGKPTSTASA